MLPAQDEVLCALLDVMAAEEDDAQWAGAVEEAMARPGDGVPAANSSAEDPPTAALGALLELIRLSQVLLLAALEGAGPEALLQEAPWKCLFFIDRSGCLWPAEWKPLSPVR